MHVDEARQDVHALGVDDAIAAGPLPVLAVVRDRDRVDRDDVLDDVLVDDDVDGPFGRRAAAVDERRVADDETAVLLADLCCWLDVAEG